MGVMSSFLSLVVCCRFGPSALSNVCILSRRGPHGVPSKKRARLPAEGVALRHVDSSTAPMSVALRSCT